MSVSQPSSSECLRTRTGRIVTWWTADVGSRRESVGCVILGAFGVVWILALLIGSLGG